MNALLILTASMLLGTVAPERAIPLTKVAVGMEGRILYRYSGPALRARAANDKAPVTSRIVSAVTDGDAMLYDVRFIPQYSGRPDIRDSLERIDGVSLDEAPAAIVEVTSALPLDHDGVLASATRFGLPSLGGYRLALVGLGVLWIIPVGVAIVKRIARQKPVEPVTAPVFEVTVADQLRPLVESAIAGNATIEDKAMLERLLIAFWRERLDLHGLSASAALGTMRAHAQAGELLAAIERWLHARPSLLNPAPDLAHLLKPYATRAAIVEPAGVNT